MKTQKEVRKLFWESFPEFKPEYRTRKRQNDYRTDIRCAFVNFVDDLQRNGDITQTQASNYTL